MRRAVIIVPTYNEVENIKILVPKIFDVARRVVNWELHVVIVDSHSPDDTGKAVINLIKKYPRLHLLRTEKLGLGRAYIEGFLIAIKKLNPYLLFQMDADLSHNPEAITDFLKKIESGADFVIGSRYMKGGSIPADWGLHRKIFSFFGNLIVRFGFMKLTITDWTSGFRAIKVWIINSVLKNVDNYSGYVFQVALLDNAVKINARVAEVPINFRDRKIGMSKINALQYVFQTLFYVFSHSSFIKYVIVGFIGFFIDFGISYFFIEKVKIAKNIFWMATVISAETAIISNFFLNNFWSFSHKKISHGIASYFFSFFKFNLVSLGALIIQAVGIQMLTNFFGPAYWYIYKVLIIGFIIIPYSYILYNKFIWKSK